MRRIVGAGAVLLLGLAACSTGGGNAGQQTAVQPENLSDPCSVSKQYSAAHPVVTAPTVSVTQVGPATQTPVVLPYSAVCPVPAGAVGTAGRTYTIGLSLPFTSNTWFLGLEDSLRLEAQRHPNVRVTVLNANQDASVQAQNITTFVAQGVDAIVVDPLQEQALVPAMTRAKANGIPVIDVDREVTNNSAFTNAVTGDFSQGPRDLAKWVAAALATRYGKPQGVIAEIQTDLGSAPQLARYSAFKQVMDQYPAVQVVGLESANADESQAYNVMKQIASANPRIDVVYAQSEAMVIGAQKAMQAMNRAQGVLFVGADLSKEGVDYITTGQVAALAPWTPLMGDVALRLAIRDIEGRPGPKVVWLPDQALVTGANVASTGVYAYGPVPAGAKDVWPIGKLPG